MNFKQTDYTKHTSGETKLLCPICNCEYTHLKGVYEFNGEEDRLAASLDFECEEGHKFSYYIHNHKGYTISSLNTEEEKVNG